MDSNFAQQLVDFFAPRCEISGKRYPIGTNKAETLRRILVASGMPTAPYTNLKSLSPGAFEKLVWVKCELTGTEFDLRENQATALVANYRQHGSSDKRILSAKLVCPGAYSNLELSRCAKTGEVFRTKDNCYQRYVTGCRNLLLPRHPDGALSPAFLSPRGLEIIEKAVADVNTRLQNWVGTVRGPMIGQHVIVSTLGTVTTADAHDSPEEVEAALRLQTAQIGGNAMINFEWTPHRNDYSERYVAGYGPKGNPYYQTRWHHEKWFTGEATGVLAQHISEKRRQAAGQALPQGRTDVYFASVLNVPTDASPEEMREAHRLLALKYRPKPVIATAEDEEVLRNFIAVNEAFNYFRVKNEF